MKKFFFDNWLVSNGGFVTFDTPYCSIISPRILDKILPNWKDNLQIMKPGKFYSCNSKLKPLGIDKLDIIFPHSTTSVQLSVELVAMEDFKLK